MAKHILIATWENEIPRLIPPVAKGIRDSTSKCLFHVFRKEVCKGSAARRGQPRRHRRRKYTRTHNILESSALCSFRYGELLPSDVGRYVFCVRIK